MSEWIDFYKLLNCAYYYYYYYYYHHHHHPRSSTCNLTLAVVLSFPANAHTSPGDRKWNFLNYVHNGHTAMTSLTEVKFVKLGGPRQSDTVLKVESSHKSSSFRP